MCTPEAITGEVFFFLNTLTIAQYDMRYTHTYTTYTLTLTNTNTLTQCARKFL